MEKSPEAYRTIREVADSMDLPQHVLRFWETRFPQIRPLKRAGGRRYYRPDDIERLRLIRRLLYDEGYTIKGVQKLFKEQGVQALAGGAPLREAPSAELAKDLAPPIRSAEIAREAEPSARLADDDLAALREALAEIVDAERILAQAGSPDV
jgi:DNA-binding transcriptional MerR regulator